jgi:hypothetical protein
MRTEARSVLAVTPTMTVPESPVSLNSPTTLASSGPLPWNRYALYGALAILGVAWDLYSKHIVFHWFGCPGRAQWTWKAGDFVSFTLQTNFNEGWCSRLRRSERSRVHRDSVLSLLGRSCPQPVADGRARSRHRRGVGQSV